MITDRVRCHRCGEQVEVTQYQYPGFNKVQVRPCACCVKGAGILSNREMAEQFNAHMQYLRSLYGVLAIPMEADQPLPPELDRFGYPID